MKKLLAMLLCVMLFVSIIPTAAFAAIDLSPAYQAREALYNAYGDLAGATAFVNTVNGVRKLLDDPTFNSQWEFIDPVDFLNGAVSYEDLFQLSAPEIYKAYEIAGEMIAFDCAIKAFEIVENAWEAIADQIGGIVWPPVV